VRPTVTVAIALALALAACSAGGTEQGATSPGSSLPVPDAGPPDEDRAPSLQTPGPASDAPAVGLPASDLDLPALALTVIAQLEAPIDTTVLADGTVLVAQRHGVVRVLIGPDGAASGADGAGRVVVDVSDRTTTDSERGLLSIVVSPDGDELLLSLTDADGDTLIEAHPLVDGEVVGPPRSLYTLPQPFANHNGAPILFTPDGLLLVGLGDGGGGGDPLGAGQDPATPLGSVLRLDVQGPTTRAARDNPFVGVAGAAAEIVATGLRNPWRMSLDAPRGELWIADVGQSEREEINRIHLDDLPGANFGWALREGSIAFLGEEPENHMPPVHDYPHGPGCSVSGGHVYRGEVLAELVGAYVFSDWCDGELRVLLDEDGTIVSRPLGVAGERVVGFGRDAAGELLVLELSGRVLRLGRA
jgi:glucose/arabinose dehydrogenase